MTFVFITAKSHSNLIFVNSTENPAQDNGSKKSAADEISKLISAILNSDSRFSNKVFSVGGFVRDQILDFNSQDLDLVIEEPHGAETFSKFLHAQFKKQTLSPFQKGLGYPIWYLKFTDDVEYKNTIYYTQSGGVDFADTQKEAFPDPTTRQRITTYGSLTEDIRRRDFTINMLAVNLTTAEILDLSNSGRADLEAGIIRTHPDVPVDQVFTDDPLRMIRAVRFASKYKFQIHTQIKTSIKKNIQRLQILSSERIWDELKKMIENGHFFDSLQMLSELGILTKIFEPFKTTQPSISDLALCGNSITLNLFTLLKAHPPEDLEKILRKLKVEVVIQKNVIQLSKAINELENSKGNWTNIDFRSFLRKYFDQIDFVKTLHPEIVTNLNVALIRPLQHKPVLTGDDVMHLFRVTGPEIKKILNLALFFEDELVLKNNLDSTDPILQNEVLKKLQLKYGNG